MKITILTYGSRGDVQPLIPLSLGLLRRGHSVKLVAPARFESLVQEAGIHFVPLAGDPSALSRQMNDSGMNFVRIMRGLMDHAIDIGVDVLRQTEEACKDAGLIIHTFLHAVGAHTFARERNIPDIHVQLFPMFTPTGDYPNVSLPDTRFRSFNRCTHELALRISVWSARAGYEQVRRRVGLPNRKLYSPFDSDPFRPPTPILCAWSPRVLSGSDDWRPDVHVTGYFFGDADVDYQPPPELRSFLKRGDSPVCVSFGSMLNRDAEKIDSIVREALRQTNNRGIILSGWSKIKTESSENLLYLDAVPHQWLLPRCKMIIHHGGAGTTSAGLRAGIPNVVIPFTADQPFWRRRVQAVGAGPKSPSVRQLTLTNLIQSILEAAGEPIRERARDIGQELRSEDGVARAVELIERYSNEFYRH